MLNSNEEQNDGFYVIEDTIEDDDSMIIKIGYHSQSEEEEQNEPENAQKGAKTLLDYVEEAPKSLKIKFKPTTKDRVRNRVNKSISRINCNKNSKNMSGSSSTEFQEIYEFINAVTNLGSNNLIKLINFPRQNKSKKMRERYHKMKDYKNHSASSSDSITNCSEKYTN